MKIVSIIMLGFVLFLSNTVMAEKKPDAEAFARAKTRILQAVTTHLDILDKFKSCIEQATIRPEVGACRKNKVEAVKALRERNKKARAEEIKAKKMNVEQTK